MKSTLFVLFLIFCLTDVFAQKDTTIHLRELQVSSSKSDFHSGLQQISIDSTVKAIHAQHSLSELLNENSAIYQKNYGPGGLATLSLRGGSSYQTAILWNGFSLASPLHGLTDLSLENNFFFNNIDIQYGGTNALWGSGAVSGNIQLNNKPSFNSGLIINAGLFAGSYSDYTQYAGISFGKNYYYGTIKFFHKDDKNNYKYFDKSSNTYEYQTNSEINQTGIFSDNYFQTGKNSILSVKGWYSYSNRFIPPTLSQAESKAVEKDINTRIAADWKYFTGKNELIIRSAYFHESVDYNDEILQHPSLNKAKSFINEITFQKNLNDNHQIQTGINHNYSVADSSSNIAETGLSRIAFFALYRYTSDNGKLEMSLSGRQEISSQQNSPFIYATGINYQLIKSLLLRTAYSTVYRNPTLNDLYWNPGGNKDLLPENGYSFEAGFRLDIFQLAGLKQNKSSSTLVLNSTVYYKSIDDWIIWYPSSSLIWSPQNISLVKSRGAEINVEYKYNSEKFSAGFNAEYFYTLSTNEKTMHANDASLHCQLIYVPIHRYNLRFFLNYHSFSLHYNHSYTGIRYTTSDNLTYLSPFNIDNAELDKTFITKHTQYRIFIRVNNIFNTIYQSIENLPMPLQTFETGVSFTFSKK